MIAIHFIKTGLKKMHPTWCEEKINNAAEEIYVTWRHIDCHFGSNNDDVKELTRVFNEYFF